MKRGMKKKVLKALRSGKYKQGKGHLRRNDCYCALGIIHDATIGKWEKYPETDIYNIPPYGSVSFLPYSWENYHLKPEAASTIWRMNDIDDKSLKEIADWIENHVP